VGREWTVGFVAEERGCRTFELKSGKPVIVRSWQDNNEHSRADIAAGDKAAHVAWDLDLAHELGRALAQSDHGHRHVRR